MDNVTKHNCSRIHFVSLQFGISLILPRNLEAAPLIVSRLARVNGYTVLRLYNNEHLESKNGAEYSGQTTDASSVECMPVLDANWARTV